MTKISAVFWDLDGTLINSEHVHTEGAIYAAQTMDFKFIKQDIDPGLDGVAVFEMMYGEKLNPENKEIYKKWFSLSMDYVVENYFKSGQMIQSLELVREFFRLGLTQMIVSNSTVKVISNCADKLGIMECFSSFIGRDMVEHGKPAPDPYLKAMAIAQVKPEQCLVFEDSYVGIQSAIDAGIRVVGIGDYIRELPISVDYLCSLDNQSWLSEIKNRYFSK